MIKPDFILYTIKNNISKNITIKEIDNYYFKYDLNHFF